MPTLDGLLSGEDASLNSLYNDPQAEPAARPTSETMGRYMSAIGKHTGKELRRIYDALTLPGDVAAGRVDPTSDEAVQRSVDLASRMTGGGLATGAEEGAAGMGIRAYHGSPYDFERFDASKIGTGEGAQVYGHGLYFAESPKTAGAYREQFSTHLIDGKSPDQFLQEIPKLETVYDALRILRAQNKTPTIEDAAKYLQSSQIPAERNIAEAIRTYGGIDNARRMMNKSDVPVLDDMLQNGRIVPNPGRMYETSIAANPEHFLDWDKPLSQQHPEVQAKLENAYKDWTPAAVNKIKNIDTVEHLVKSEPEQTANDLWSAGIPGVKYADQGSRSVLEAEPHEFLNGEMGWKVNGPKGDQFFDTHDEAREFIRANGQTPTKIVETPTLGGYQVRSPDETQIYHHVDTKEEAEALADKMAGTKTRNYVVFNDKIIDILKKYGLAGLVAAGAAHYKTQQVDHDPFAEVQ